MEDPVDPADADPVETAEQEESTDVASGEESTAPTDAGEAAPAAPAGPAVGLDAPRGREAAIAAREQLDDAERERVERTVSELLDLLGKAHTMAVLRAFAFSTGPWRFTELERELGVAPNTLSERLKELVAAGLLVRRSYDEIPPRVEYEPTGKAEALFPAFGHFHRWAREHSLEPVDERRNEGE